MSLKNLLEDLQYKTIEINSNFNRIVQLKLGNYKKKKKLREKDEEDGDPNLVQRPATSHATFQSLHQPFPQCLREFTNLDNILRFLRGRLIHSFSKLL